MVFEPTFNEINHEAENLPDLVGDAPEFDASEPDGGLSPGSGDVAQDAAIEGEALEEIIESERPANELPPEGL